MRAATDDPSTAPPVSSGFAGAHTFARDRPYSAAKLVQGVLGPYPLSVLNYWSPGMAAAIEQGVRAGRYDSVHLGSAPHLARYVPVIRAANPSVAIVADWFNIESELFRRYATNHTNVARRFYAQRTAHLVERAESDLLSLCDRNTVPSDRERDILRERIPTAAVETLPNGVDVGFFDSVATSSGHAEKREILFVGSMDYHANIDAALWMVHDVWPLVRQRDPGLRLSIVGRAPTPAVRALAAADIDVTGTVDDVRPYYGRALAVIVPLRVGSGTRLKILEAMAAGVPVVSTPLGAEGIAINDAVNIVLATTGEEFANAISLIASSAALGERLAREGHRLVEAMYDWSSIGATLFEIHEAASAERKAGRIQPSLAW